jgi:hypothetical protein
MDEKNFFSPYVTGQTDVNGVSNFFRFRVDLEQMSAAADI